MVATVQKSHFKALKTLKHDGVQDFVLEPHELSGSESEPYQGLTASHAPELHWCPAVTRRESPLKIVS